ncbi:MAG: MBL fold metallo-hydrolase [Pedobacter sp.]|nr:MAG: MBL fold metallo-hydrolase [Pedobacter sp.]
MSLFITSLNTGSNGNCFYIGNEEDAVLIDVGLSCKETEIRMNRLGLSMDKVKAIFITHEHSDHIRGLPVIAKKYQLPIYITHKTMLSGRLNLPVQLIQTFTSYSPARIGSLQVVAFPKKHDAAEPHSFLVQYNDISIGVFTDIGGNCDHVTRNFSTCNAVFLEANYDSEMLDKGRYPYFLKNRIRSGYGHLSNNQALELFKTHRAEKLSHLILSHLSKDNNCPNLVYQLFSECAGETQIIVGSRERETAIYQIGGQTVDLRMESLYQS